MANTVLCAIDLGPSTTRVVSHAAAFAGAIGAELEIVHSTDADPSEYGAISEAFYKALPYDVSIGESTFSVQPGPADDAILREAAAAGVELIVIGSSARNGLARLLLGSTSEAVLQKTRTPVLLVPPTELDIVTAGPRPAITCGAVLAAVDLADVNLRQIRIASKVAAVAACPLHLLTIAGDGLSDHDAAQRLRALATHLDPVRPRALIVRRGDVAEEISRCALSEKSGLVVMGLRDPARGRPGLTIAKVLQSHRAFVLAVPA
ncbi:MAG: universal stress protein [Vicinamibacterales bacterium]